MAWLAIAAPILAAAVAVYWLRQPLVYDVLYLATRRFAIWYVVQMHNRASIADLAGLRYNYTHYSTRISWQQWNSDADLSLGVRVAMHGMPRTEARNTTDVWPWLLHNIDDLTFNRNRRGSNTDRANGRALDLSDTVTMALMRCRPGGSKKQE